MLKKKEFNYKEREKTLAYMMLSPVLIVYVVFIFYPVLNGIIHSFTDFSVFNPNTNFVFLDNFKALLKQTDFYTILLRTIFFVIVVVFIQYVLGLIFALLLSLELPYTSALKNFAMLPWVLPVAATVLAFNWIVQPEYGLLNVLLKNIGRPDLVRYWFGNENLAMPAVMLIHIWRNVPFYGIVLYAGLKGIPKDLYESSSLDGANAFQVFWNITFPLIRKQSLIVILLHVLFTFNNVDIILLSTGGGPVGITNVMSVNTYNLVWGSYQFGIGTASAVIMFILLIPVTLWSIIMSNKE